MDNPQNSLLQSPVTTEQPYTPTPLVPVDQTPPQRISPIRRFIKPLIIFLGLTAVVALGTVYFVLQKEKPQPAIQIKTDYKVKLPTPVVVDTTTWQTYANPLYKFSFKYPPDLQVVSKKFPGQEGVGLYDSKDAADNPLGKIGFAIYEKTSTSSKILANLKSTQDKLAMKIGEKKEINSFVYVRHNDIKFKGMTAQIYTITSPTNPMKEVQNSIIFRRNGNIFAFSSVADVISPSVTADKYMNYFDQILATVEFTE